MVTLKEESLKIHKINQGKLGIYSKVDVRNTKELNSDDSFPQQDVTYRLEKFQ
ncbi:hypothetical protein J7E79_15570 [Bacillus sp. ISL-40]|nr:hypothetical protein [Bacillus sp. ISL-40]MBT2720737.1 hypothetical protein [Bacillus sp. ISL-46]MBT2740988.1 hypothetical protein [Bacillus sp. ISL-77]